MAKISEMSNNHFRVPGKIAPPSTTVIKNGIVPKSLGEAVAYHERASKEFLQSFINYRPKIQEILRGKDADLKAIIFQRYASLIPFCQIYADKKTPAHLLFHDYIDGLYLDSELEIYKEVVKMDMEALTGGSQYIVHGNENYQANYVPESLRNLIEQHKTLLNEAEAALPFLRKKIAELKMKIENEKKYLPPHLGHDFKIIFSLGCHETIKDAEHFKGVISAHNPDFFIFEIGDGTYHKTMAPRYMRMEKEETEGIKLKFDIGTSATNNPFYQEIGKIIESSQREYKMRAVEYLPINEVLEGHKLSREYASGGRVSLDYKNPEPGLRNTFIQHKGMHQGSAIRERRIIENIVELLESFDLYYPKIAEKKDISIVIHYGTTHFPMTNALERKTGKENISIIEVPQPSIISHLKTMKEFGLREDRTYEVPCDRWVESKIFLDLYFRAASLPGLMPDDLLSNLLRFTFIKRATFDTIFEKIRIGVDANYIFKTELKEIIKMVGKPLKAILKEDHPEYSDFIDKIEEPI